MTVRYPLEALRALRADEEEAARALLATALAAAEDAARRVEAARLAASAHEAETAHVRAHEEARALAGAGGVEEALRARAWRDRRGREAAELRAALANAEEAARAASDAAEQARAALTSARLERETVDKHHARWLAEQRRAADARAEAEADDLTGRRR